MEERPDMMANQPRWREQCEAASAIQADFGIEKALGYLLGEKFMNLLREADTDGSLEAEVLAFAAEVRRRFTYAELERYFTGPGRIGALGHVLDARGHELFRSAGALGDEDVSRAAQDAIRFERMRRMVLES